MVLEESSVCWVYFLGFGRLGRRCFCWRSLWGEKRGRGRKKARWDLKDWWYLYSMVNGYSVIDVEVLSMRQRGATQWCDNALTKWRQLEWLRAIHWLWVLKTKDSVWRVMVRRTCDCPSLVSAFRLWWEEGPSTVRQWQPFTVCQRAKRRGNSCL